jgi:hypothetical protein
MKWLDRSIRESDIRIHLAMGTRRHSVAKLAGCTALATSGAANEIFLNWFYEKMTVIRSDQL